MRPSFGTLIPSAFMETTDSAEALINTEIRAAFASQLSDLTFDSADITYDEYLNLMNVSIVYELPNSEKTNTTIALINIDGTNPASEENI